MTAGRYTAVFTGLLSLKRPGEYLYLSMDEATLRPGTYTMRRGRPPYEKMGRGISFGNFPEDCRRLVLDTYRRLWNL